jgi:hypothetical protein
LNEDTMLRTLNPLCAMRARRVQAAPASTQGA